VPLGRKWDKRWFAVNQEVLMYSDSPKSQQQRQKFLVRDIIEVRAFVERARNLRVQAGTTSRWIQSRQALAGGTERTAFGSVRRVKPPGGS